MKIRPGKKIQPPKGFESMLVRNKLVKWWTHNDSETAMFADDTKLYKEIRSSDDELALQTDLSNVGSWSTELGLEFNKTKSHHQSITRKTKTLNTAYDKIGAKTSHERDLGVWVSTFTHMIFVYSQSSIHHFTGLFRCNLMTSSPLPLKQSWRAFPRFPPPPSLRCWFISPQWSCS